MIFAWNSFLKTSFLCFFMAIFLASCAKKNEILEASGDLQVQIGVQQDESTYKLSVVQLNSIFDLSSVNGKYAKFFYSPGATDDQLTGQSPKARFIKTSSFYVPSDVISLQMATLYYHMQNLAEFDFAIGAKDINQWPRAIGLETQIVESGSTNQVKQNNAFYNGQTDSMMFVPYNSKELPITVNAGIIAHEHFHSLFYKIVLKPAVQAKKIFIDQASIHSEKPIHLLNQLKNLKMSPAPKTQSETKVMYFNETFLRGINEGIADFWGWAYSDDPRFMKWSLSEYEADRQLNLRDDDIGIYETDKDISNKVDEFASLANDPRGELVRYAYQVGTPYARFLKELTLRQARFKKMNLLDAKKQMAALVFEMIKTVSADVQNLKAEQMLKTQSVFNYFLNNLNNKEILKLNLENCQFLLKYVNLGQSDKDLKQCQLNSDQTVSVE